MKLLTFLGTADYKPVSYCWQDKIFDSRYAPAASCHFLSPEVLTVFLSEDAQEKVYPDFKAQIPKNVQLQPVAVPWGRNEAELWQIFDQVSQSVQPGEEVAFDITHGFRSYPLVGLLAAAFLRSGLGVDLKAVLYGAYDARDTNFEPPRVPVFDLSPMLSLLEWADASDRFNRTGDSRYLASLVRQQRKGLALQAQGNHDRLDEAGWLGNLANALTDISQSLQLIRPVHVMQSAAGLADQITKALPALARSPESRPFSLLLDSIDQAYAPLGMDVPLGEDLQTESLEHQRRIIRWYVDHEHWVQAVTLAREWLISWAIVRSGEHDFTQFKRREQQQDALNSEAERLQNEKSAYKPAILLNMPNVKDIIDLWGSLREARNDIDHAGMRDDPLEAKDLITRIQGFIQKLEQLPL
jgi:CRISPR-associated DxTHG motif protein